MSRVAIHFFQNTESVNDILVQSAANPNPHSSSWIPLRVRDLPIWNADKQYANTTSDWEILTASIRTSFASMPQDDDGIQSDCPWNKLYVIGKGDFFQTIESVNDILSKAIPLNACSPSLRRAARRAEKKGGPAWALSAEASFFSWIFCYFLFQDKK